MAFSQDKEKEKAIQAMAEAEDRFKSDDLSGAIRLAQRAHDLCPSLHQLSNLLAALRILRVAARHQQSEKQRRFAAFWHAILGSKPADTVDALKRHYRRLCIQIHPDKNPSAAAEGAFKLVVQAFEILSAKNAAAGMSKKSKKGGSNPKQAAARTAAASTQAAHGTFHDCGGGTKIFVSSSSSSRTTQVRSYVDANGVYRISIKC